MWAPVSSGSAAHPPLCSTEPRWAAAWADPLPGHPRPLEHRSTPMGCVGSARHLQLCRKCSAAARMGGQVWIPCCLPRGWERGSISHPGGCWPGVCPCYVPVPCLSAAIRVSLRVRRAEKSRSSAAAGRGWRQLHHSGSLQPPCGCSLSAQAQTSLKLIPPQSLGLLGLLSSGHRSSLDVQVVLFPRAVAFCEVFPCGSTRLPLDGRAPLWGGGDSSGNLECLLVTKGDPRELESDFV